MFIVCLLFIIHLLLLVYYLSIIYVFVDDLPASQHFFLNFFMHEIDSTLIIKSKFKNVTSVDFTDNSSKENKIVGCSVHRTYHETSKQFTMLVFLGNKYLSSNSIIALAHFPSSVKIFRIGYNSNVTNETIIRIIVANPSLTNIEIGFCSLIINDQCIKHYCSERKLNIEVQVVV
jgi:hypothetical protein